MGQSSSHLESGTVFRICIARGEHCDTSVLTSHLQSDTMIRYVFPMQVRVGQVVHRESGITEFSVYICNDIDFPMKKFNRTITQNILTYFGSHVKKISPASTAGMVKRKCSITRVK